jgi:hypothetical protein
MTPSMLRQFWGVVSGLNLRGLSIQNDDELVPILLNACRHQPQLNNLDNDTLLAYITSRLHLIRDLSTFPSR